MPLDPNDPMQIYGPPSLQMMGPPSPPAQKTLLPKKKSPYAAMRANATPVPAPAQDLGRQQPNTAMQDPMSAPAPSMPPLVARGPSPYPGMASQQYGRESIASGEYGNSVGREKQQNVYQSPADYAQHQQEVLDSPIMQKLAAGVEQMHGLRQSVIESMRPQEDLSPVMAMADYMANGKGTARSGYRRPASFEETAANLQGLLQAQNQAQSGLANAALEQTGGLKSGQEGANNKVESSQGQKEGFNIPHPPFMNPFTMAQSFGKDYGANPTVKEANEQIAGANQMLELLKNPNWFTDQAMRGSMVQSLGVNRITQNELQVFGGGSPDLWNRAQNAFTRATTGETLSSSDRQTLQEFAQARMRAALAKQQSAHQSMSQGLGSMTPFSPQMLDNLAGAQDVKPTVPVEAPGASKQRSEDFAKQFMQLMQQGK